MAESYFKSLMYGDMLNSPGYEVEFAVGLSYSLDLEALISVPISFGMLGDSEDFVKQSPACLLAAIRKSSDKIAVFCNPSSIKVPRDCRTVYSLLENSIFPVKQKGNFHPKLWAIQEVNKEGRRRIKLVVLSRNLTFDDSLDVVVTLTGDVTGSVRNKSKYMPVVNLLDWVAKFATQKKREKVRKLCDNICCIDKFAVDEPFDDYEFYAFNPAVNGLMNQEEVYDEMQGRDMIVFSPFIDEKTLNWLFEKANRKHLVTRRNNITQNVHDIMGLGNIFAVNESLIDDEETKVDLHAKMYFVSKGGNNNLYLGSANATHSAFNRNTELLLRLHYIPYKASFDKFKETMLGEEENQYVPIDTIFADECTRVLTDEEIAFGEAIRNIDHAKVVKTGDQYDTIVYFKKCGWNVHVSISPLQGLANKPSVEISAETKISGMLLKDLSEFYILTAGKDPKTQQRSVVKIRTEGIPEERDNAIFQSIVDTENKFINYVSILLSDHPQETLFNEKEQERLLGKKVLGKDSSATTSLYEEMLNTVSNDPDRLDIIKQDLDKFGDKVPESFKTMLDVFLEARKYVR